MVAEFGWVDFEFGDPLSCLAAKPPLNSIQLKQNWAGSGTLQILVKLTQFANTRVWI